MDPPKTRAQRRAEDRANALGGVRVLLVAHRGVARFAPGTRWAVVRPARCPRSTTRHRSPAGGLQIPTVAGRWLGSSVIDDHSVVRGNRPVSPRAAPVVPVEVV
jgi:hypothetical protein